MKRVLSDGFRKIKVSWIRLEQLVDSSQASRFLVNGITLLSQIESSEDLILGQFQNERFKRMSLFLTDILQSQKSMTASLTKFQFNARTRLNPILRVTSTQ